MKKLGKKLSKNNQTVEAYSFCHCGCYASCLGQSDSVSYNRFLSEKYGNEDSTSN